MDYGEAVEQLINSNNIYTVAIFAIAALVLFLLIGQVVKLWRDLFGKPRENKQTDYEQHCRDAEERFKTGESHIEENRLDILDLKEGQRVTCIATLALLNHAIHNGNDEEMRAASASLNNYLINRR